MVMNMKKLIGVSLVLGLTQVTTAVGGLGLIRPNLAAAVTVGYYTDNDVSQTGPSAPITQAGFTPVQILDISTFDLNTIDILMVNESNKDGLSPAMSARLADIQAWVQAGGAFVVHDRF